MGRRAWASRAERCGHPAGVISAETSLVTEASCSWPGLGQPSHTLPAPGRLLRFEARGSTLDPSQPGVSTPRDAGRCLGTSMAVTQGALGIEWVGTADAAQPPPVPRTAPLSDLPSVRGVRESWSVPINPGPQACDLSCVLNGSTRVPQSPGGDRAACRKLQARRHLQEGHTQRESHARSHVPWAPRRGSSGAGVVHTSALEPRVPRPTGPQRCREHVPEPTRPEAARESAASTAAPGRTASRRVSLEGRGTARRACTDRGSPVALLSLGAVGQSSVAGPTHATPGAPV